MSLFAYGMALWLLLMVVAIGNGVFRERVLRRSMEETQAHVVSTLVLTAIVVVGGVVFLLVAAEDEGLGRMALLGLFWLALTLAFEFLFGHYVDGQSWQKLLENYDVTKGHIWPLVPAALLLTPIIFGLLN